MLFSLVSTLPCLTAAALPLSRGLSSELLVLLKLAQLECVRVGSVHINHSSIWLASPWALLMHAPLLHLCAALTLQESHETPRPVPEEIALQQPFCLCKCAAESQKHVGVWGTILTFLEQHMLPHSTTWAAKHWRHDDVNWTRKFMSTYIIMWCLIQPVVFKVLLR